MRYPWSAFAALVTLAVAVGGQQPEAAETANYAYIGTYTRDAPGGDFGQSAVRGHLCRQGRPEDGSARAPSDRPFRQSVVPRVVARSANPVCHQRGRGFRRQGGGLGRGLSDRRGKRRDHADQPASAAGVNSCPPRGRPEWQASCGGALHGRLVRGLADRRGWQPGRCGRRGDATGQRPQRAAPGGAASARHDLRSGRSLHRHRRSRHRQGRDLRAAGGQARQGQRGCHGAGQRAAPRRLQPGRHHALRHQRAECDHRRAALRRR